MASNDDIEKLLAEVAGQSPPAAASPSARSTTSAPARRSEAKPGGRLPFAVVIGVLLGGAGFLVGWLTPFLPVQGFSMGLGAAVASFITALIAGPPRWFSS